jgi:hypothetical protein
MLGWFRRTSPRKISPESVEVLCEQRLELMLQDADAQASSLAHTYRTGLSTGKFPEPDLMVAQWKEPLTDELREGSSWRASMNGNIDLVVRWREFFYPVVNRALEAQDTDAQRNALRVVLLDSGYTRARSRAFLRKGVHYKDSRGPEERQALAAKWNAGWSDIAEITREHSANVAVHECTIEMVRFVQRRGLDDASLTDYFALWDTVCGQLWNGTAETVISQATGGFDPIEAMLPLLRQTVDQRRADILAGANFEWDREKQERDALAVGV